METGAVPFHQRDASAWWIVMGVLNGVVSVMLVSILMRICPCGSVASASKIMCTICLARST